MSKILVVGGFGYFGSILVDILSQKYNHEVDVYDLCLFDNEDMKDEIKFKDYYLKMPAKDYEYIIWSANIDCPSFYERKETATILNKFKEEFTQLCSNDQKKNFINLSTYAIGVDIVVSEFPKMCDYLKSLEKIVEKNKGTNIRLPVMYGPSPRMRWDTIVNSMILSSLKGEIILTDDWLVKIPIGNVLDCVEFVISRMYFSCEKFTYFTDIYSMIELVHIIKSCMNPECKIEILGQSCSSSLGFKSDLDPFICEHGILEACDNFKKNIENNTNPDFANDIYNNELMFDFTFKTKNLSKLIGT